MTSRFPSGPTVIRGNYTLTCSVSGADNLASDTTIAWTGPNSNTTETGTSLDLRLDSIDLSDAGRYSCVATISNPSILSSTITSNTAIEDITLQSMYIIYSIQEFVLPCIYISLIPIIGTRFCSRQYYDLVCTVGACIVLTRIPY